ncbi:DUF1302 domain-containing protein [Acinetobacter sichuanensis]|uniref:DUF1302 domain-containing protein n=1 Tax=Acinetobacter sichuanensis TaxID=2136183 RepID=UPI00280D11A6|nr:DUF1302 domain-containing protein [Acinetobacter sichuanensis]MDQ9021316.1 DUF1302 domain-containing protein [Acinetobacter sichuanensis]
MVNKFTDLNGMKKQSRYAQYLIASVLAVSIAQINAVQAASVDVFDDWKFKTNTTLSMGTSWSMEKPSASLLFAPDAKKIGKEGNSVDTNGDNGRQNFNRHDVISQIIRGLTETSLSDGKQGAVLSAKYWYDHAYETGRSDFEAFDDRQWPDLAKFKGIELWDAYLWRKFTLPNDQPLEIKLGKQALNWGKSRFFQHGINSVNAIDVAAMNRPGGDAKERVIPAEMLAFNLGLNKNLQVEGFYQYKFRPSVLDGCGTFLQISDFTPESCGPITIAVVGDRTTETAMQSGSYIPRGETQSAKDGGQYGIALKQTFPDMNNLELGAYYANYHSRFSAFEGKAATGLGAKYFNTASYYAVYPEDVRMFALSLSAKVGTTAWFAELNHKPNQPLGFNGTDLVQFQILAPNSPFTEAGVRPEFGAHVDGYARLPVSQLSVGAADAVTDVLGAKNLTWMAELAVNHIGDIDGQRFGRSSAFGRSELSTGAYDPVTGANACISAGSGNLSAEELKDLNRQFCNAKDGFFSEWSAGYRLRAALNYPDLLAETNVSPSLTFRHDVTGYGPNFQEGQMAVGVGVTATYQKKYSAEIAYQNYFGSNEFSTIDDRDYASMVFKMNF